MLTAAVLSICIVYSIHMYDNCDATMWKRTVWSMEEGVMLCGSIDAARRAVGDWLSTSAGRNAVECSAVSPLRCRRRRCCCTT